MLIIPANTLSAPAGNDNGIFGFGISPGSVYHSITHLISDEGVVASVTTGVGTGRSNLAACEFGGDKAIFAYGLNPSGAGDPPPLQVLSLSNLVSDAGVVASDVSGVGTARQGLTAVSFGDDKGLFGFGTTNTSYSTRVSMTNLVTNVGVIGTDVTGVGTDRHWPAATQYGGDKGIIAYGTSGAATPVVSIKNLVSNVGVVASDVTGVGTARRQQSAITYGYDKGIFVHGHNGSGCVSMSNLVSNVGVVASDVSGVGTARYWSAGTQYGQDKGIFGYGNNCAATQSMTNLISNSGVVASDVSGVGVAKNAPAACSFN